MQSTNDRQQAAGTYDQLPETRFPCGKCGGILKFSPASGGLQCGHCGTQQAVPASVQPILEHDFSTALKVLEASRSVEVAPVEGKCTNCAAEFQLEPGVHAGACPYCGSTIVVDPARFRSFQPESLLPFSITEQQALQAFRNWLGSLWFAPGSLKRYATGESRLKGVYLPYWTYDTDTNTTYAGMRGDIYYVRQNYLATVNGRRVTRSRRVPRIRWSPAAGRVQRHFDDLLIGASRTLPRQITDRLAPWTLRHLIPFQEAYLSGFASELYQVELDSGFEQARLVMEQMLRSDVRRRIGGDQQQVTRMDTQYANTRFKSLLLPVWMAEFRFRAKRYRFVVNGRTGKTQGERPYSYLKIGLAVVMAALLLAGGLYLAVEYQHLLITDPFAY